MWSVYIVECADGTLYTGVARDVQSRVEKHNSGKGAKYTASRLPVVLQYVETAENRSTAQQREHALKSLTRGEKWALIQNYRVASVDSKAANLVANSD